MSYATTYEHLASQTIPGGIRQTLRETHTNTAERAITVQPTADGRSIALRLNGMDLVVFSPADALAMADEIRRAASALSGDGA